MRNLLYLVLILVLLGTLQATTLERMSVDTMVQKSTAIVRGSVLSSSTLLRDRVVYTVYRLKVAEVVKGSVADSTVEVYVPGGTYNGVRMSIAGSPVLSNGSEYVVFLWLSPRGTNQVIGLGQGVFDVQTSSTGNTILSRGPIEANFVTAAGQPATDDGLKLTLSSLRGKARARQEVQ